MRLLVLALIFVIVPLRPALAQCTNPAGVEGEIVYNATYNLPQYCDGSDNWIAMVGAKPDDESPKGCPNIGETCIDGSIYAGLSPDGNVAMYTTPADAPSLIVWNDGSSNWVDTAMENCTTAATPGPQASCQTGEDNTALLVGLSGSGSPAPYQAAEYCDGLSAHGFDDWYLPASDELKVLYDNKNTGDLNGTFNETGSFPDGRYWSSTEVNNQSAWNIRFSDRGQNGNSKNTTLAVRCVRRHQASQLTQIVPNGLIGHWRLDETSGTTAFDSSGNGHHGTVQGGLDPATDSVDGIINRSYSFDGVDDYVDTGAAAEDNFDFGTGPYSISAWAYVSQTPSPFQGRVVSKRASSGGWFNLDAGNSSDTNRINFYTGDPSTVNYLATIYTPQSYDQWYHIVGVRDASGCKFLYVDGILRSSGECEAPIININNSQNLLIGKHSNHHFKGKIDDVRVYDRALDADEITEIYQARDGIRYDGGVREYKFFDGNKHVSMTPEWPDVTDGLVGHWKLDETEGTTAFDSSGNGHHGTIDVDASTLTRTGAVGRALQFSGNEEITIPHDSVFDVTTSNVITFSFWQKQPAWGQFGEPIEKRGGSPIFGYSIRNEFPQQRSQLLATSNGANNWGPLISSTANDTWLHIVCTFDRQTADERRCWKNTSPTFANDMSGVGTLANMTDLILASDGFNGGLDDVRFYNRTLSANEIQTLYNMGAPEGSVTALPQGCPNVGDVCDDGTIYAGLSPDGDVEMFAVRQSLGRFPWNNGNTSNYTESGVGDVDTGESNTQTLIATDADSTGAFEPHLAAQACYNLNAHGASDWYLPSPNEARNFMPSSPGAQVGAFQTVLEPLTATFPDGIYWASRESDTSNAIIIRNGGSIGKVTKDRSVNVVCVRKGPAPRCANPYGLEGQMVYNTDYDVVQYCDGARWRAVGKYGP